MTENTMPEPVAWQRRLQFSSDPGASASWETCTGNEAKDPFERRAGYEYRPLYSEAQMRAALDRAERVEANLYTRDKFIVDRGLWGEFVDGLPLRPDRAANATAANDALERAERAAEIIVNAAASQCASGFGSQPFYAGAFAVLESIRKTKETTNAE